MQIKNQISLSYILIFLLLTAISVMSINTFKKQGVTLERFSGELTGIKDTDIRLLILAKNMRTNVIQVQQWLTDISATRALDGLNDGFDEAKNNANAFNNSLKEAIEISKKSNLSNVLSTLQQMENDFPPYYEVGQKMAKSYIEQGPVGGNKMMLEFDTVAAEISEQSEALVSVVEERIGNAMDKSFDNISTIKTDNHTKESTIIIISIIALILTVSISLYIFFLISRSFRDLFSDLLNIEKEDFTSDMNLDTSCTTEFGKTAIALEKTKKALQTGKQMEQDHFRAKKQAEEEKRKAMNDIAENFEQHIQSMIVSISSGVQELNTSSRSMSDALIDANKRASNVSGSSEEANLNVQTVAAASEQLSASVSEISQQLSNTTRVVNESVSNVEGADKTAQTLSEATDRIGGVVELIRGIAEQINLLALNATIESARAGDAGKGFAVVASEVKNLANQASNAVEEIDQEVTGIQEVSKNVIDVLSTIKNDVNNINEYTSSISSAVEEQSATTQEIAHSMQTASSKMSIIANDIATVTQSTENASTTLSEVIDASAKISEKSENMYSKVNTFISQIRSDKKKGDDKVLMPWSDELSLGVEYIDEQHKKLVDMINNLYKSMVDKDESAQGPILRELAEYTIWHFDNEEKIFAENNYPDSTSHKKSHKDLLVKVTEIVEGFNAGKIKISLATMEFLKDWLTNHIMKTDKAYVPFFKKVGIK